VLRTARAGNPNRVRAFDAVVPAAARAGRYLGWTGSAYYSGTPGARCGFAVGEDGEEGVSDFESENEGD